jgi:integrase
MFTTWFSGEQRRLYGQSVFRARIDHVGQCLRTQEYLDVVVRDHLHEWLRFASYLEARGLPLPTSVYADTVQAYFAARLPGRSATRRRFVRASVRLFLETDAAGQVGRRIRPAPPSVPPLFEAWVPPYLAFLQHHRGLALRTLRKRARHLRQFLAFLAAAGVGELPALTAAVIQDFCTQLPGPSPRTRLTYRTTLRSFLRWAYVFGRLPQDLSRAATAARQYRRANLPDALPPPDVEARLAAVDRSTPIGRRDYAVLLLAARYGLRPSDIRALCLEQIDWRQGHLTLQQAKTGYPLTLPLLPEVAQALVAYLQAGRPTTTARQVFVRHKAPFVPFVPENNLATIMRAALRRVDSCTARAARALSAAPFLATRLLAAASRSRPSGPSWATGPRRHRRLHPD